MSERIVREIQAALARKPCVEIDPQGMYFAGCDSFTVRSPHVQMTVAVERRDFGHVMIWLDREDAYPLAQDQGKVRRCFDFRVELQDSNGKTFEPLIEQRKTGPRLQDFKVSWTTSSSFSDSEEWLDRIIVFVSAVLDKAAQIYVAA